MGNLHARASRVGGGTRSIRNPVGLMGWIGLNLISGNKLGNRGPLSRLARLSQASHDTRRRVARKGVHRLEEFLICENRRCRFLISLRDGSKLIRRRDLIFRTCPECDHEWSGRCPFCLRTLEVTWERKIPCCSHCQKPLMPEVKAE
jgi:hypothetical protein